MNIQGQFISEEDRAARRLVEQAQIIIKSARGDVPESFLPLMFAGVPAEDVVRYEARELAELAEAAWQVLQERKGGLDEKAMLKAGVDVEAFRKPSHHLPAGLGLAGLKT